MATLESFLATWTGSAGSEKANAQLFFTELCDVLDLPHPSPATNDPSKDDYVFERRVHMPLADGDARANWIDVYRKGCFVLESKQGAAQTGKGFAKRDTPMWNLEMQKALGQARGYALTLPEPPPFLIVCDVGHVFELHATFDGSTHWRPFPDSPRHRIYMGDLRNDEKRAMLRAALSSPTTLDPSKRQARVTREIAETIADLAKTLEKAGHPSETVARFLMRCLFTMFAEDVGLFEGKRKLFEEYIEQYWLKNPPSFVTGVSVLWSTMNTGGVLMTGERVHKFNGGLFADHRALDMTKEQLETLLRAAKHDWSDVEPAIFGTLLERALDPKERHALGAHYTPRAYVERLVRPTLEEPLRAEWLVVRSEARQLIERSAGKSPGEARKDENAALTVVKKFHSRLCEIRVLDPACGTGNFLYVALDLMKQLEDEVLDEIARIGGAQSELLELDTVTVHPKQFRGIEKKPWAKEIAELVLWIGYLRWQWRLRGTTSTGEGSILEDVKNIECRDAVLDWDGAPAEKPKLDEHGRPVTRWDGETTKTDPLTGREVPDERATVPLYDYPNARKAEWPQADYVVGNPPFLGGWRLRSALGDGYVHALWKTYPSIPEKADYVMYWWHRAAEEVRSGRARRFGLITTNSVTQVFQRRVLAEHLEASSAPLSILFAIPDHPWVDSESAAAVRIAMSVGGRDGGSAKLGTVVSEDEGAGNVVVEFTTVARIGPELRSGVSAHDAVALASNEGLCSAGVQLYGNGFIIDEPTALRLGGPSSVIRRYLNGRDLVRTSRAAYVIDFFGLEQEEAAAQYPAAFQHVLMTVKPERDQNRREAIRRKWWRFGWERPVLRQAMRGLERFITTPETAKHRVFVMLDAEILPDNMLTNIALDDAYFLGILSSRVHVTWALAGGGRLGVGNDPRYTKGVCFDPYPFPLAGAAARDAVRDLAERLDAHRKQRIAAHPTLTITGMYNVLERLRAGEVLSEKERRVHEEGLVSILRQIHDELDAAVFEAYGWPATLSDEEILERLVALNAERAAEEARGLVRWLRPDFQAPKKPTQLSTATTRPSAPPLAAAAEKRAWPKTYFDRASALRDLVFALPHGATFDASAMSARFSGKGEKRVAEIEGILETFAALGQLLPVETAAGRQFARPFRAVG